MIMSSSVPHPAESLVFTDLLAALIHPTSYPQHPARVELTQTHISAVFLAGDEVYKLMLVRCATPNRMTQLGRPDSYHA